MMTMGVLLLAGCTKQNVSNSDVIADMNGSESISETEEWLTYTSDVYGFNLMYPESYVVIPPRKYIQSLEEHNIIVHVNFKYDLPKYETQYLGMADRVVSQESLDVFEKELSTNSSTIVNLPKGYRAEVKIDGNENSNLIKQYSIVYNDYYITLTADADPILEKLGLEREHFASDGILSENAPTEIVEYFDTFDDIVATLDLSGLQSHVGNENFMAAAENDVGGTVFDGCGDIANYEEKNWFDNLKEYLSGYELTTEDVTELCFSETKQIVIILAGAAYCRPGYLFKYDITNSTFEEAEKLNDFFGCTAAPTAFGERTGQIIQMYGSSGDAGCGNDLTFDYNYEINKYRTSSSYSYCYDGLNGEKTSELWNYY
jgi:hypothetical protein